MYDLDRSPLLANRYGVVNYDTAVVEGANRMLVVRNVDESGLTTNLIKLIEGFERTALFTVGHGENDPGDPDERRGYSQVAKGLEAESYRIERSSDLRLGSVMALLSGPAIAEAVGDPKNALPKMVATQADDRVLVDEIFLRVLNRPATDAEVARTFEGAGLQSFPREEMAPDVLDTYQKTDFERWLRVLRRLTARLRRA